MSGAPSTTLRAAEPSPAAKLIPDHFFALVNGWRSETSQAAWGLPTPSMIAVMEELGESSAAPSCRRASKASSCECEPIASTPPNAMAFSVRVPVLSAHTTSTLARPSMAGSSLTRHLRMPSRTTPRAKATDVVRMRPSGIMGTRAPVTLMTTWRQSFCSMRVWLMTVRIPRGTRTHVIALRILSMPDCSSECTRENLAASAVSLAA